ncbi:MAG: aspartate 1-decarboxylase [Thermoanaerobaculaceae bacterium]|nr:aspartate 1-decarboxylase [Thermoanaerobaculaceae bacterium]MDI9620428.1 aspartate 1-decarboxylase [Acidobacteriota bacterium]NLH12778.1 aspartate 1-decarboxylase [Holophagae bacterium]HPW55756.1 aspartate 1-decarboxylase [Thermoanaerobaculaceae bacterium]
MRRPFLRAKIHRARVTGRDLHYEGSITIDSQLLAAADILVLEQVDVYNVTTGTRFSTYCIPGAAGSGTVEVNGAAAHLVTEGDLVIVAAYCWLDREDIPDHRARVVLVDETNHITAVHELTPFDGSR